MLHVPQGFTGTTAHDLLVARRLMEQGNLSTECKSTFVSDVPIKQGSNGIAFLLLPPFSITSSDMRGACSVWAAEPKVELRKQTH